MTVRVIARLDIKGPNLVKGIQFEGLRVLGKPEVFARHYYDAGADELLYVDAVASLYGRNSLVEILKRTASNIFIPLTVGGGLRTIDDIREVLRAGADKVALNTAALRRPQLISEAARAFGSSTVVVSIEAVRRDDGSAEAFTDYGRESTGVDAVAWATEAAELGAGEIMITSVEREGTGKGVDLELTERIASAVSVPVIACGGVGSPAHALQAVTEGKAQAIAIASLFHYHLIGQLQPEEADFSDEGNTDFLRRRRSFGSFRIGSIQDVKAHLVAHGVACRTPDGIVSG